MTTATVSARCIATRWRRPGRGFGTLRPFRGVSNWYLAGYVAMLEWANNLKSVTDGFLRLLLSSS